jgi:hypothetical protein
LCAVVGSQEHDERFVCAAHNGKAIPRLERCRDAACVSGPRGLSQRTCRAQSTRASSSIDRTLRSLVEIPTKAWIRVHA